MLTMTLNNLLHLEWSWQGDPNVSVTVYCCGQHFKEEQSLSTTALLIAHKHNFIENM